MGYPASENLYTTLSLRYGSSLEHQKQRWILRQKAIFDFRNSTFNTDLTGEKPIFLTLQAQVTQKHCASDQQFSQQIPEKTSYKKYF